MMRLCLVPFVDLILTTVSSSTPPTLWLGEPTVRLRYLLPLVVTHAECHSTTQIVVLARGDVGRQ